MTFYVSPEVYEWIKKLKARPGNHLSADLNQILELYVRSVVDPKPDKEYKTDETGWPKIHALEGSISVTEKPNPCPACKIPTLLKLESEKVRVTGTESVFVATCQRCCRRWRWRTNKTPWEALTK